jgi:hypothetical protein
MFKNPRPTWVPLNALIVIASWLLCICVECEPCTGIDSRQVIRCHFLEFVELKMNLVGNRCHVLDD